MKKSYGVAACATNKMGVVKGWRQEIEDVSPAPLGDLPENVDLATAARRASPRYEAVNLLNFGTTAPHRYALKA